MFNHHRGLWGYTGTARDGEPLTVQSTGMGGPSAAIVVEELIGLGARTLIRIGTCGALVDGIELGTLVPVESALAADGDEPRARRRRACRGRRRAHVGARRGRGRARRSTVRLDGPLLRRARGRCRSVGGGRRGRRSRWRRPRCCRSRELRGVRAGCLLAVTDLLTRRSRARGLRGGRGDGDCARRDGLGSALGSSRPQRGDRSTSSSSARPRRVSRSCARGGELVARRDGLADARRGRARSRRGAPRARSASSASSAAAGRRAPADASRSSSRSTASSMPSSRCDTDRSRRVSRSMSAADGMPSAPIAASCAWTAFSRASNARASARVDHRVRRRAPRRPSRAPPRPGGRGAPCSPSSWSFQPRRGSVPELRGRESGSRPRVEGYVREQCSGARRA